MTSGDYIMMNALLRSELEGEGKGSDARVEGKGSGGGGSGVGYGNCLWVRRGSERGCGE